MKRVRASISAFVSAFALVAVLAACGGDGGGDGDAQGGDGITGDVGGGDVQVPPGDADGGGGQAETVACTKDEDCVGQVTLGECQVAACSGGACVATGAPDGTECDDENPCTLDDACTGGTCVGTEDPTCEPPCDETADCAPFEDDDLCNGTLVCTDGTCQVDPLTVVACPGDTDCATYVCDGDTGNCDAVPMNVGEACDGEGVCEGVFLCSAEGTCVCEGDCPPCGLRECGPNPECPAESCGECEANETCDETDGICVPCVPDCQGNVCGLDPVCGTLDCGTCADNEVCTDGDCICVPDCEGQECGPDGCGGDCGPCTVAGEVCDLSTNQCEACTPDCSGLECGLDPVCNSECGPCADGATCQDGVCVPDGPDPCLGVSDVGCCEDGLLLYCNNGVLDGIDCTLNGPGGDACGWNAEFGYYDCGAEPTEDPAGAPRECPALECPTDCAAENRVCDPLPGCPFVDCGTCENGLECNAEGQCVEGPPDPCLGVSFEGCCQADGTLLYCDPDLGLQRADCNDPQSPGPCGWVAGDNYYNCGGSGEDPSGENPLACPEIECGTCAEQGVQCGVNPRCPWLECETQCAEGERCLADGTCEVDRCLGVPDVGCCAGDTIYGCADNMLFSADCTTEGNVCGWYTGDAQFPPAYYCGPADLLVDEDPSGQFPGECVFDTCDNEQFCADAGYECGLGCPGQECGQCAADEICGPDRQCHPLTCDPANEGAALECGAAPTTVQGDTAADTNAVQDYPSCVQWPYTGPETWHAFTASCDGPVTVELAGPTDGNDLDILVLEAVCAGNAEVCLGGSFLENTSDETFTFDGVTGTTYYVVVEGFNGSAGAYDLTITCACTCEQQCGNRVCGPDPVCGTSCGTCDAGDICTEDGQCVTDPCLGATLTGCCDGTANYYCSPDGRLELEECGEAGCGWIDTGFFGAFYACGGAGEDPTSEFPLECDFPACDNATFCAEMGYECGLGCPGAEPCGECDAGSFCNADRQCEVCSCEALGLECGTHPVPECALECGTCGEGLFCTDEQVCEPIPFCGDTTTVGTIECGDGPVTVSGDTTDSVNVLDTYPGCGGGGETGPEEIHTFTPPCSGTVVVDFVGPEDMDMDVFVLGPECRADGDFCLGSSQNSGSVESAEFEAEAGVTYYIVVEGYSEAVGAYELSVNCACTCTPACDQVECGVEPNCGTDCGGCPTEGDLCVDNQCVAASARTCETPAVITCDQTIAGDNTLAFNNLPGPYPCSTYTESSGEEVYLLSLDADQTVTLNLTGMGDQDLDLYVLESTCAESACTAFSAGTGDETIELAATAAGTYYVVVDGFGGDASPYSLSVACGAPCVPDCTGLACGPDPVCGVECGPCEAGQLCTEAGTCEAVAGLTCATPGTLACGETQDGDSTTAVNLLSDDYECTFGAYANGEDVHQLTGLTAGQIATVTLSGALADLDLMVLEVSGDGQCGPAACIGFSNNSPPDDDVVQFDVVEGATYYAVVENYDAEGDTYSLALACAAGCSPACGAGEVCVDGTCVSLCDTVTASLTCDAGVVSGDTTGGTGIVDTYSCTDFDFPGPEHVYEFVAPGTGSYTFTVWSALPADHDLIVLGSDCDPASCLDSANESVTIDALQGETYYIVVDGYSEGPEGSYQLAVSCGAVTHVAIVDFEFVPSDVFIGAGETVRWINLGPSPHTTTSSDDPAVWDSGTLQVGESFDYTFDVEGDFLYECTLHPAMTGSVSVFSF